ncbi:probable G-protein coupled receptor 34b [Cololabis saira]|uniref:probable G-protein coupled receptor 34b n=1 Tax=Cololabis saira TaxID=129043 RepID=UPI002AD4CE90|nr:probable G-protein coupled receptor 34b [Cololabis saira]
MTLVNATSTATNSGNLSSVTVNQEVICRDDGNLRVPLATFYTLIFLPGLAGNLLALYVFFCVHSKKNSVRVFLINIAFADLLLLVCLPFRISYHIQGNVWKLGPYLCNIVGTLFYMNMYISIVLLGMISVDRYLKINHSGGTRRRVLSTQRSTLLCAAIWIVSFALSLPLMMLNSTEESSERCFHYKTLTDMKWKAYINILVLVVFWLAFISLMVSYGKIALKLRRRSQEKPDLPNASRYAQTARKSFFILFLFTLCFVPYHVLRAFYIYSQITDTGSCLWRDAVDKANEVALLFSALNSCLDPVIYFMLSSSVRKEVKRVVSRLFCEKDVRRISGSSSSADVPWDNREMAVACRL